MFTVYLKKVRYHSPTKSVANTTISSYSGGDRSGSSTSSASSDDGISHLEWETVRVRFVKAATLPRLVEALASEATGELESTYVNVFLATYRSFASAKQVLNLLLER